MPRWCRAALALLTVLRLVVAARVPLAPDEAYYWVWSRALAPGFLDHPPMVALWIWAGTALCGDGSLGVRLLAPLSAALGSVLLARAADDLFPGRRAGVIAAVLLNATLMFGIGSVTMTPDTPVVFFWTVALWALVRVLATGIGWWWLAVGAAAGAALASKYSAALLVLAIPCWLVAVPSLRPWLRRWQPWAGAVLAGLMFLPVLAWNAGHGWASFLKQGGRAGAWEPGRAAQFLAELVAGQVGLATPVIAVLFGAGLVMAARRWREPAWALLAWVTLLPLAVFVEAALGDRVQANWLAVVFPGAAIAAAGIGGAWRRLLRPGIALGFALTLLAWTQAALSPFALPMRLDPTLLRLGGWDTLAAGIAARTGGDEFVVSDNYSHAAELARLLPAKIPVYGLDPRWALFDLPDARPRIIGQTGLLLRSARRGDDPDPADWARIEPLGTIARARDGMTAEAFRLYRVTGRAGTTPIAVMPRPR